MLVMFTIYDNPSDYPGKYVVRRWVGLTPDRDPLAVVDSLAEARAAVPPNPWRTRVGRQEDDDPTIVETWL